MYKIIGVITARMGSTRLPGKVMKKVAGKSIFVHHIERMREVKGLSGIFLATSKDPLNKKLIDEAKRFDCGWYAGEEQDIVERHIKLCQREQADAVIRVTCDCPLFDIGSASSFVEEFQKKYRDLIYVSNMTIIQGTLSELISYNALIEVHKYYRGPAVSTYIYENKDKFNTLGIEIDNALCRPEYRLTVDEPVDLEVINRIYQALYKGKPISLYEVYIWLDDNPEVAQLNSKVTIKGCNKHVAGLTGKAVYFIVRSGEKYVILDENRIKVEPQEFMKKIDLFFPEVKHNIE